METDRGARLFEDFLVVGIAQPGGKGTPLSLQLLYHLHKGAPEADAMKEVRRTNFEKPAGKACAC